VEVIPEGYSKTPRTFRSLVFECSGLGVHHLPPRIMSSLATPSARPPWLKNFDQPMSVVGVEPYRYSSPSALSRGPPREENGATRLPGRLDKHMAPDIQLKSIRYYPDMIDHAIAKVSARLERVRDLLGGDLSNDPLFNIQVDKSKLAKRHFKATTEDQLQDIAKRVLIEAICLVVSRLFVYPHEESMPQIDITMAQTPIVATRSSAVGNVPDLELAIDRARFDELFEDESIKPETKQTLRDILEIWGHLKSVCSPFFGCHSLTITFCLQERRFLCLCI
jgi:hypothetical protein